jgi:protein SCO1
MLTMTSSAGRRAAAAAWCVLALACARTPDEHAEHVAGTGHAGHAMGEQEVAELPEPAANRRLPYYQDASFTPQWYESASDVPSDFHAVRAFSLVDQRGEAVSADDLADKIYVANFFFTSCPGICPTTMTNMARLQAEFEPLDDVVLLSHSVTPDADSVSVLRAFAEKMRALSSRWYMVTGDREEIYDLGKRYYFADEDLGERTAGSIEHRPADDAGSEEFLHTESFFLVDRNRHIRGVYNGMNRTSVQQLVADVQALRQESGS